MNTLLRKQFILGVRDTAPSLLGTAAWSLTTGIAMAKSSLAIWQGLCMSFLVYAGSAQLAVLPLLLLGESIWAILGVAAIANLRFVIFSFSLQSHFNKYPFWRRLPIAYLAVDICSILFSQRFKLKTASSLVPIAEKEAYYYGLALPNWLVWHTSSVIGLLFAQYIPKDWGLELAGTLALLALALSLINKFNFVLASIAATIVAMATYFLPYKLNLILGIFAAVTIGILLDSFLKKSHE